MKTQNQIRNIENLQQYNVFETMFMSERRENVCKPLDNIPKDKVVAILDAYDEMIHKQYPDAITVEECIELGIKNGIIETNLDNINNLYRELAAVTIDVVEQELYDLLPEPIGEDDYDCDLSKICGCTYYNLEDRLTELFKNYKF